MPRTGFESATPATKRPQTYALEYVDTGISYSKIINCSLYFLRNIEKMFTANDKWKLYVNKRNTTNGQVKRIHTRRNTIQFIMQPDGRSLSNISTHNSTALNEICHATTKDYRGR
jgi:hypothetical protein